MSEITTKPEQNSDIEVFIDPNTLVDISINKLITEFSPKNRTRLLIDDGELKRVYCKNNIWEINQSGNITTIAYEQPNSQILDATIHTDGKIYAIIYCEEKTKEEENEFNPKYIHELYEILPNGNMIIVANFLTANTSHVAKLHSHENFIFASIGEVVFCRINIPNRIVHTLIYHQRLNCYPVLVFHGNKVFGIHNSSISQHVNICDVSDLSNKCIFHGKKFFIADDNENFYKAFDALRLECGLHVLVGFNNIIVFNPKTKTTVMEKQFNFYNDMTVRIKQHVSCPTKFYIFSIYEIYCCELIFDSNTKLSDNSTTENIEINGKIEYTIQALETVE